MKSVGVFLASNCEEKHKPNTNLAFNSLLNSLQPFQILMLLFGIDIRLKVNEIDASSKRSVSLLGIEKLILVFYRLIFISYFILSLIDTIDAVRYKIYFKREISLYYASLLSIYFCSTITYAHIYFHQKSIVTFLRDLFLVIHMQFQENANSVNITKWMSMLRKWSFVFIVHELVICGLTFYLSVKYTFVFFNNEEDIRYSSQILSNMGFPVYYCELAAAMANIFRLGFSMPFLHAALNVFCILLIILIIHFESLSLFATGHHSHKLFCEKFLKNFMAKHRRSCQLVNGINNHFSFLIFIWFSTQIFLIILFTRIIPIMLSSAAIAICFVLQTILLLGSFLLECLLISDINSKVVESLLFHGSSTTIFPEMQATMSVPDRIIQTEVSLQFHIYCFSITMCPPSINGWGFFTISKHLLVTAAATILTYSLILNHVD